MPLAPALLASVILLLGCGGLVGGEPGYATVEMRAVVNMGLQDSFAGDGRGGWTDQGGNDMRFLPVGRQLLRGIPFDIIDPAGNGGKAALIMAGSDRPSFPDTAEAKSINRLARSVYFLHGAGWCGKNLGATYTVVYADQSTVAIPIRDGIEIGNWWQPADTEACRVGWFGPNLANPNVGLLIFAWQNPAPDKLIASIRFTSLRTGTVPCIAAVTLSDQDARLPEKGFNAVETGAATLGKGQIGEVRPEDKLPPLEEGKNGYRVGTKRKRYANFHEEQWPVGGLADVSFLNEKPAGTHGRLINKNGRLAWADGSPARFLATNTIYGISFPNDAEEATRNATWLAANGINLVRIHHFAHSGSSGTIFDLWEGSTEYKKQRVGKTYWNPHLCNTRKYDPESWDKLDLYLAALKAEGIYAELSLRVFPNFGRIEAAEADIPPSRSGWRAYDTMGTQIFVKSYIDKLDVFVKDVLSHRNPHTGLTYAEDPAIAIAETVNEDSIFFVGNDPNRLSAAVFLDLHEQYNNWLLARYGSPEALRKAWGDGVMEGWEVAIRDLDFMRSGRPLPPQPLWTAPPAGFTPVDLSPGVTAAWRDTFTDDGQGGWFDCGRELDMRFFPTGHRTFLEVPFAVPESGAVLVADRDCFPKTGPKKDQPNPRAANTWPKRVEIPVGAKARSLEFLHTAGWMPDGKEPFAFYDVVYADGSVVSIGLRKGFEITDWSGPAHGQACRVAWSGMSLEKQQIGVNRFAWDNPKPDQTIAKVVVRLEGNPALLALLGLTCSSLPAHLPNIDDLPSVPDWQRFVRLWGYGRFSKDGWSPALLRRASDQIRFLHEVQTAYFQTQKGQFTKLGFQGLVLGSNWWAPPLMTPADLHSNAGLDMTDAHNYGGSVGLMRAPGGGTMSSGPARVLDKPFMLSEWNPGANEEYRLCALPLITLYGQGLNGWDAPMQFGFRDAGWGLYKHYWDFWSNYPSDVAQYPAMALAIRRGDLREGPVVYRRHVAPNEIFAESLAARHPYEPSWFAIGKVGTTYVDHDQPDAIDQQTVDRCWDRKAGVITSATGELTWDYERGIAVCRTPRTQGAVGFLSRMPSIDLPAGSLACTSPFAAVWVSSLTDQPISASPRILISTASRQAWSAQKKDEALYKPMIMEGFQVKLNLRSRLPAMKAYAVGYDGRPKAELAVVRTDTGLSFTLDTQASRCPYALVTAEAMTIPAAKP